MPPTRSVDLDAGQGPKYLSDEIGATEDTVALVLGEELVAIAEGWEVHESVLEQPAAFSIRLGWGDVAAEIMKKYPPNTPFKLYVGQHLQFSGHTDARCARQNSGGATEVEIRGRDALAPLRDSTITAAVSVNVSSYAQLVWYAMQQVGIVPEGENAIDPFVLKTDNAANRDTKAGVSISQIATSKSVQQILDDFGLTTVNVGRIHQSPQAKLHESWHEFIRRHIDRAGLMLWAAADGTFVLSAPNGNQAPAYSLVRRTGQPNRGANVVSMSVEEDAAHRHSECIIYGRGGGKADGRVKSKGSFEDEEMQLVYGYTKRARVYRDANVKSAAEGALFARRVLAEERREGWRLEYTFAGHTLPVFGSTTGQRAVVVPDTVINVTDDELQLSGNYYVESVIKRRSPETTTQIRLMRIEDLLFAAPGEEEPS